MKKIVRFLLIVSIVFMMVPVETGAVTLGEYKSKLAKFKSDYEATQNNIKKTQSEINSTNGQITNIKSEMINMSSEIAQLKEDVTKYKEQIKKKELETKKLVEYYQLSQGSNMYLEYAFGAESITDLIYRMSVIEQLTNYNSKTIKDLNKLIDKSKKRQKEINEKEKQLQQKQKDLEGLVVSLGEEKNSLSESGVSVSKQIKIYETYVNTYVKLGCKDKDVIGKDCAVAASAGAWRRPTTSGYVTSEMGWRWGSLHRAIDISNSNPYKTKIYAVASGTITAIYSDSYGARVVLIEHYDANKRKYYTSDYCHMSSYNPSIYVGKKVTSNDWIGYMGMSGKATGPHLHMEIFDCRLYNLSDRNCSTWSKYVSYAQKRYNQGWRGPRSLIKFPSSWSSR